MAQAKGKHKKRRKVRIRPGRVAHSPRVHRHRLVRRRSGRRGRRGEDEERRAHVREIQGLVLIGVSIWLLVAMGTYYRPVDDPLAGGRNLGGRVGFYLADMAFLATGLAGLLFGLLGLCWGCVILARRRVAFPSLRLFAGILFVISFAYLVEMGAREAHPAPGALALRARGLARGPVDAVLAGAVRRAGALDPDGPRCSVTSFMLATEMAFFPAIAAFRGWAEARREERGESLARALWGWSRQLFLGLWDFVRGARLGQTAAARAESEEESDASELALTEEETEALAEADPEEDEEEREDEADEEEEGEEPEADLLAEEDLEDEDERGRGRGRRRAGGRARAGPQAPGRGEARLRARRRTCPSIRPRRRRANGGCRRLDLLEPPERKSQQTTEAIDRSARMLEAALASFRVEATVVGGAGRADGDPVRARGQRRARA